MNFTKQYAVKPAPRISVNTNIVVDGFEVPKYRKEI
jgi:hypothetical protein